MLLEYFSKILLFFFFCCVNKVISPTEVGRGGEEMRGVCGKGVNE